MSAPPWLDRVLAEHGATNLDHPDGRSRLAEAILEAIPRNEILEAVRASITEVVGRRVVMADEADVDELARNALHGVTIFLETA